MFLILLAGLVGVPEDQLKAATLLGASPCATVPTIVLPRMKTIIIIALAIRVIECFKIFDTLFIMTGGGPGVATETISVYIYKIATQDLIWGYVAAIALAILIVPVGRLRLGDEKAWGAQQHDREIHLENLVKRFGGFTALKDDGSDHRRWRVCGPAGPVRLRQVHHDEHDRRHGAADPRAASCLATATWRACRWASAAWALCSRTMRSSPICRCGARTWPYGLRATHRPAAEVARRVGAMADLLQLGPCWTARRRGCR